MVDFLIAKIIKTHWAGRWSQINRKGTFLVASPNQRSKYVKPQFEVKFWRPLWFDNHDKPFWKWHTKCNWMVMQKLGVTSKNHLFFPIFNWFWKFSISLEVGQTSLNQKISQKVSYIGLKYLIPDGQVQNFLPAHTWRVQAGTESWNSVSIYVRCYLLILLQFCQSISSSSSWSPPVFSV